MNIEAKVSELLRWREHPIQMVVELFGIEPDAWQAEVLEAFPDPERQRISMQACVGPGKTAVEAWCIWNFLLCYGERGEHPKGAAVSVDWANLMGNLWPELSKWQQRSELLRTAFEWTSHRIKCKDHPTTWFFDARGWSKTADKEAMGKALSGLHSKYVMAVVDESGTIPIEILKTAEQALTNCTFGKIIQGGNPSSLDGMLHVAATVQRDLWYVVRVTGDPDDPRRSPRIDIDQARRQIALYGRDDPWVKYSILGEFPPSSVNTLLGTDEVQAAMEREIQPGAYEWSDKRLGVDVARYGGDMTVLFPRQGLRAFKPVEMRHKRDSDVSVDIANRIMMAKHRWGGDDKNAVQEFLDSTGGWAAGARDILSSVGHNPVQIQYHAPAPDPRYKNMKAWNWWNLAQWVKGGGSLPQTAELVAELTQTTYTFVDGKMLMEDKDRVRDKIGRSPNHADALSQTFAIPDMPDGILDQIHRRKHAHAEFDPYRDPGVAPGTNQTQHEWNPYEDSRI